MSWKREKNWDESQFTASCVQTRFDFERKCHKREEGEEGEKTGRYFQLESIPNWRTPEMRQVDRTVGPNGLLRHFTRSWSKIFWKGIKEKKMLRKVNKNLVTFWCFHLTFVMMDYFEFVTPLIQNFVLYVCIKFGLKYLFSFYEYLTKDRMVEVTQ